MPPTEREEIIKKPRNKKSDYSVPKDLMQEEAEERTGSKVRESKSRFFILQLCQSNREDEVHEELK